MKRALAIRHVEIEHLGMLAPLLKEKGFKIDYLDTPKGNVLKDPLDRYDLLVVLGGYMGTYETDKYPFLFHEFKLIEEALKKDIPILGICLGAQMLAKVLGARVYKGRKGREIGWFKITKTCEHPYFRYFPPQMTVFEWHGDTFDLPQEAVRIYSSERYENQAFVYKKTVGLQFHIEVDKKMIESWTEAYQEDFFKAGVNPESLLEIDENRIEILPSLSYLFLANFLGE